MPRATDGPRDFSLGSFLVGWSRGHGGIDPAASPWVLGWLRLVHRLASPLARRGVSPDVVTLAGTACGVAAAAVAAPGGRWPLLAVLLVLGCAVLDGLDGAVATLRGTASAWGRVFDSLADRCTDVAFFAAMWLTGAPGVLCAAAGALTLLLEGVRASAGAAGMREVGVVTVWERPSRVIVTSLALGGAGLVPRFVEQTVTGGAVVAIALAVAAVVQLLVVVRRRLR